MERVSVTAGAPANETSELTTIFLLLQDGSDSVRQEQGYCQGTWRDTRDGTQGGIVADCKGMPLLFTRFLIEANFSMHSAFTARSASSSPRGTSRKLKNGSTISHAQHTLEWVRPRLKRSSCQKVRSETLKATHSRIRWSPNCAAAVLPRA